MYIEKYNKYKHLNDYIQDYSAASNAATGSKFDSNANVDNKNVCTLSNELHKGDCIGVNRYRMIQKLTELYGEEVAEEYIRQLEAHEIYRHDETHPVMPYCVSITLYPFLLEGMSSLGAPSVAPNNLGSFCGNFINLVFAVSSQFAGACLYKEQRIAIKYDGKIYTPTIQDFVNFFNPNLDYPEYEGWKYTYLIPRIEVYEQNKWVKIKTVFKRKYTDLIYKITTINNRTVLVSKDHKFRVLNRGELQDIKAEDLQIGDTLVNTQQEFNIDKNSEDYNLGQFIGMVAGDGSITNDNEVRISVNYNDDFILDFLKEAFPKYSGKDMHVREGHKCYCAYVCSRDFVRKIRSYFVGNDTYTKGLDLNKNYSAEFLCGFLDGLVVTDGAHGRELKVEVTSETLIDNMITIMHRLTGEVIEKRFYDDSRENRKRIFKATIPAKYYKLFDLALKFERTKYAAWGEGKNKQKEVYYVGPRYAKRSRSTKPYQRLSDTKYQIDYGTDVIANIETFNNDDDFVYEIETESHYYSINGYLTHNCATPEYLAYMDYFIRKEYGDDYYLHADDIVDLSKRKRTIRKVITDSFEQVAYSLNEPAAARGYQAVFWNISYYDHTYFNAIFEDFVFPDGSEMQWESVSWLQKLHMEWLNQERLRKWLTFPVETVNLVYDKETKHYYDEDWASFAAKMWAKGHSFFCYNSDSADSLSSCCRLKNGITDNVFSYTLGAGGISTGSKAVITINVNRLVQDAIKNDEDIATKIREQAEKNIQYLIAFNELLKDELAAGLLPVYDAGYISLPKQYLTTGINGFVEAAEYMGLDISDNEDYYAFGRTILEPIMEVNKAHRTDEVMFNCEYVPAENVGVKHATWDKQDGYVVPRNCYNSYFFKVEDDTLSILDKMAMHGNRMVCYLDGGSAAHLNLSEHLTEEQYRKLLDIAAEEGCSYFTFNIPNTICNECGHISKHYMKKCHKCGSDNVDWLTRIIGYVKRISAWSEARQKEGANRFYHEER